MTRSYKDIAQFTAGSHISRIQQSAGGHAFRFYATEQFLVGDWQSSLVTGILTYGTLEEAHSDIFE
ncbi:hypothetical protein A3N42_22280 [Klebsiella aerogenes]|nr:hypothetical protein AWI08_00345 [Klebsiella aerogenes]KZP98432.1 hypothetical protein A3N42_22280 [Klebsiella aerogenes]